MTIDSTSITPEENFSIPSIVSHDRSDQPSFVNQPTKYNKRNLITVKRSNKILEASSLPVVLNLNPRSLYNKQTEFRTLIEQTEAGLCCISETWDRSHLAGGAAISDLIDIEGYRWVKNVVQRKRKGGKPAILVSEKDFYIKELSPTLLWPQSTTAQPRPKSPNFWTTSLNLTVSFAPSMVQI